MHHKNNFLKYCFAFKNRLISIRKKAIKIKNYLNFKFIFVF